MKSYLMLFVVLTVSISLVFINCENTENPTQPLSSESGTDINSFDKKPVKKPASKVPAVIELFEIFDNQTGATVFLLENDIIITGEDQFVDLSTKDYRISYRVTHPQDIGRVVIALKYDENCDYQYQFGPHDMHSYIIYDSREGLNDTVIEGTILTWSGKLVDGLWVLDLFNNDEYTVLDQFSSYYALGNPAINPDPDGSADHYKLSISASAGSTYNSKGCYLWIKAAVPANIYHVDYINAGGAIVKGKVQTYANVKVVKDSDGLPVEGAKVWGKWNGVYTSDYFSSGFTDVNGIAMIDNCPKLKNNISGEERFTVYAVFYPDGSFNPYENTNWIWPSDRAYGSFTMPIP